MVNNYARKELPSRTLWRKALPRDAEDSVESEEDEEEEEAKPKDVEDTDFESRDLPAALSTLEL